jgi:hypothetical protein
MRAEQERSSCQVGWKISFSLPVQATSPTKYCVKVQVHVSFRGSSVSESGTQTRVKVTESFIGNLTKVIHAKIFIIE